MLGNEIECMTGRRESTNEESNKNECYSLLKEIAARLYSRRQSATANVINVNAAVKLYAVLLQPFM